jgi:hypothetical protein
MSTQGVGTFAINSFWESGRLIFYEKAYGHTTTGDVFILGADYVQVGDTANDVNFVWKGDTTGTFTLDAGAHTLALTGMATSTDGTISMADDTLFTIGTTTSTAATKITAEFDKTTTGIGVFNMGSIAVPMVLNTNPGSAVVAHTVNVTHSAGAGDCDDLIAMYGKVTVSGDGDSGLTAVGVAPRLTISGATSEAYCIQSHAVHASDDAITALSAGSFRLSTTTANFTAANSVNAGQFIVTGDGTYNPTCTAGRFTVLELTCESPVTNLDAVLRLNNGGTTTDAIIDVVGGSATYFMDIAGSTFIESGDITSGKSCTGGIRIYNSTGSAIGVIPFYED